MPRGKSSDNVLTIGFIGTGVLPNEEYLAQQLEEHLQAQEKAGLTEVRFIVPITIDGYTEDLQAVLDYALDPDINIPYETITIPTEALPRANKKYVDGATKSHAIEDPLTGLVKMLAEAPHGELVILWDAEDEAQEEMERYANVAIGAEVPTYDLLEQMTLLDLDEDGVGGEVDEAAAADQVYDEAALEEMEVPALKDVAKDLGISPVPRTKAGLIEKILDAQPNQGEAEGEPAEEADGGLEPAEDEADLPEDPEPPEELVTGEVDFDALKAQIMGGLEAVLDSVLSNFLPVANGNGHEAHAEAAEAPAAPPKRRGRPPKVPATAAASTAPTARRGARRG